MKSILLILLWRLVTVPSAVAWLARRSTAPPSSETAVALRRGRKILPADAAVVRAATTTQPLCSQPCMNAQRGYRALFASDRDDTEEHDDKTRRRSYEESEWIAAHDEEVAAARTESAAAADEYVVTNTTASNINGNSRVVLSAEKAAHVARCQQEIDRILSSPDAPLDVQGWIETGRIASLAPPVHETAAQQANEGRLAALEQSLYQAVKSHDLPAAAILQREISQQHVDDCAAVLQVNAAFYKAFSEKNYENMERLWLQDGTACCIHPSHAPLLGSSTILKSWKSLFEVSSATFQSNWIEPHNIRVSVKGANTAVIVNDEHVFCRRFVRGHARQTELVNKLISTNIFRKVGDQWYLTHHHAAWHASSEAVKQAMAAAPAAGKTQVVEQPSSALSVLQKRPQRRSRNGKNDGTPDIGMDGILGVRNAGPLLGPSGKKEKSPPVSKRIVMGTWSDILSGNLGDILSGDGNKGNSSKGNKDDDNEETVIRFSANDDDDEYEVDDDDEDDDDDDEDDGTEAVSIIKEWAASDKSRRSKSKAVVDEDGGDDNGTRDTTRQGCITALRKLSESCVISPKQKRVLMTDIISCSAKGEYSMVEVAYELLCGEENSSNDDDQEDAISEFAEQCRVFADNLLERPRSKGNDAHT